MNLIEVRNQEKRIALTKERLKTVLVKTAQLSDEKGGLKPRSDESEFAVFNTFVDEITETLEQHGFFIAYVGD